MSYDSLVPLIRKIKSTLSPENFQAAVNVAFHDYEADYYDAGHQDMKLSLQEQVDLLVEDLLQSGVPKPNLRLLDIGCGTGLSTQALLNSKLGAFIDHITLMDTSPNMLKYAKQKAEEWGRSYETVNGYVSDLDAQFDVIIICSVLHHIPNLEAFFLQVESVLKQDGFLIHLQDPNADFASDAEYLKRVNEFNSEQKKIKGKKKIKDYFPKSWKKFINLKLGRKTYIDLVNDRLMAEKVIQKRMSADEIWSVTDIHIGSKLNNKANGISFQSLESQLKNFRLINKRSYGFFGVLKSDLPIAFSKREEQFIRQNDLTGRNISGVWVKIQ